MKKYIDKKTNYIYEMNSIDDYIGYMNEDQFWRFFTVISDLHFNIKNGILTNEGRWNWKDEFVRIYKGNKNNFKELKIGCLGLINKFFNNYYNELFLDVCDLVILNFKYKEIMDKVKEKYKNYIWEKW